MVKETRHIFDLSDIAAVRFRCNHCKSEFVQSLKDSVIPETCPNPTCSQRWEAAESSKKSSHHRLIDSAKNVLTYGGPPMTIRFEINGEEDK